MRATERPSEGSPPLHFGFRSIATFELFFVLIRVAVLESKLELVLV